ncbi:hypothetical protein [Larsenimonas suaedae]|uniref:DUF3276 family protein n=1 Tax=Larsenimonas suaedae TaxID=1851019 RepID=A0ABU1H1A0_9GAMM|nr:hypothetical protein [Larsenimonas suaedae]MCM2973789.1 hypothetical protein [Larsenimonas suaedae]MDR5897313.1 hypothetical protein [Larsenimonas suaedae]
MALKNTFQITRPGFSGALRKENTYVLVTSVEGRDVIRVKYAYKDIDTNELLDERTTRFKPQLDGTNYIKQAYNHLKSLDEFKDATDYDLPKPEVQVPLTPEQEQAEADGI